MPSSGQYWLDEDDDDKFLHFYEKGAGSIFLFKNLLNFLKLYLKKTFI